MTEQSAPLLSIRDLTVEFNTPEGVVHAVDGVSYDVYPGETLGIVGESGSGKNVSVMSLLRLIREPPGRIVSGEAVFEGLDLLGTPKKGLRGIRGNKISMVFQDPMTSLNPVFKVGQQIAEAVTAHHPDMKGEKAKARAVELLRMVGVPEPERRIDQYPHQFSGGMRQRAMIATAIANDPALLIADEPTTALDVTVQAQIMALLEELQQERQMGLILITHDLGVVADVADRIAVMYAGRIVEKAEVHDLYAGPAHPYTRGLLESIPRLDQKGQTLAAIGGLPPNLMRIPPGCPFNPRCRMAQDVCRTERPPLREVVPGRFSACHFAEEVIDA
jgi:oligopeptide transport system ATP-binding protein